MPEKWLLFSDEIPENAVIPMIFFSVAFTLIIIRLWIDIRSLTWSQWSERKENRKNREKSSSIWKCYRFSSTLSCWLTDDRICSEEKKIMITLVARLKASHLVFGFDEEGEKEEKKNHLRRRIKKKKLPEKRYRWRNVRQTNSILSRNDFDEFGPILIELLCFAIPLIKIFLLWSRNSIRHLFPKTYYHNLSPIIDRI